MADDNRSESTDSRILDQHHAYQELRGEYSAEVANQLTSKNLERHGVMATPQDVEGWHTINQAAADGNLDIREEWNSAEERATFASQEIINQVRAQVPRDEVEASDDDDEQDESEEASDQEEEEMDSLGDIFGYEDDDDNHEAAIDHILKLSERAD